MEEILRKIWQVLKPKPRSALGPRPRINDGSYPVGTRWPYDSYERDREMNRRHDEGYLSPNRKHRKSDNDSKDQELEEITEDQRESIPDWKIRDEQYREDAERERRHEENYWGKSENSSENSSKQDPSNEPK